jgi:signal peptidase I
MNTLWYIIAGFIFLYLIYDAYKEGGMREAIKFSVVFITLFMLIRTFLVQPFLVEGPSMEPTFSTNNYLLVDKFSYKFLHEPKRGEVIVFKIPDKDKTGNNCIINLGDTCYFETDKYLIKRIIGLPGEKVVLIDGVATIFNKKNPNGMIIEDKEILFNSVISDERTLGDDEYYVMGDNRSNSSDSRYWGALPYTNIVGSPLLRLTPFSKIGLHPGHL